MTACGLYVPYLPRVSGKLEGDRSVEWVYVEAEEMVVLDRLDFNWMFVKIGVGKCCDW